jgi:hypothetical protein
MNESAGRPNRSIVWIHSTTAFLDRASIHPNTCCSIETVRASLAARTPSIQSPRANTYIPREIPKSATKKQTHRDTRRQRPGHHLQRASLGAGGTKAEARAREPSSTSALFMVFGGEGSVLLVGVQCRCWLVQSRAAVNPGRLVGWVFVPVPPLKSERQAVPRQQQQQQARARQQQLSLACLTGGSTHQRVEVGSGRANRQQGRVPLAFERGHRVLHQCIPQSIVPTGRSIPRLSIAAGERFHRNMAMKGRRGGRRRRMRGKTRAVEGEAAAAFPPPSLHTDLSPRALEVQRIQRSTFFSFPPVLTLPLAALDRSLLEAWINLDP